MPVGSLVRDSATGREGTLRDVLLYQSVEELPGPAASPARRLVFLRPVGGGLEWTTEPDQVVPAGLDHSGEVPEPGRIPRPVNRRMG
ncbi:hypothetical protein [[Kitasatospora] papulosa]|uniref:hypothetical protein n=1 Tax=[Kitasatospora] papulosa TaxID=1464011 RepID=UPI0036336FAF